VEARRGRGARDVDQWDAGCWVFGRMARVHVDELSLLLSDRAIRVHLGSVHVSLVGREGRAAAY
jgi:hypothetical protein